MDYLAADQVRREHVKSCAAVIGCARSTGRLLLSGPEPIDRLSL